MGAERWIRELGALCVCVCVRETALHVTVFVKLMISNAYSKAGRTGLGW